MANKKPNNKMTFDFIPATSSDQTISTGSGVASGNKDEAGGSPGSPFSNGYLMSPYNPYSLSATSGHLDHQVSMVRIQNQSNSKFAFCLFVLYQPSTLIRLFITSYAMRRNLFGWAA